jgi:hypothetical protein
MSQYAGLEALRFGEDNVQAMVAEYDRRRQVIVGGLNSIGLPPLSPRAPSTPSRISAISA